MGLPFFENCFLVALLSTEYKRATPSSFPNSAAHTTKVDLTIPTNSFVRIIAQKSYIAEREFGNAESFTFVVSHIVCSPLLFKASSYSPAALCPGNRVAMAIVVALLELPGPKTSVATFVALNSSIPIAFPRFSSPKKFRKCCTKDANGVRTWGFCYPDVGGPLQKRRIETLTKTAKPGLGISSPAQHTSSSKSKNPRKSS